MKIKHIVIITAIAVLATTSGIALAGKGKNKNFIENTKKSKNDDLDKILSELDNQDKRKQENFVKQYPLSKQFTSVPTDINDYTQKLKNCELACKGMILFTKWGTTFREYCITNDNFFKEKNYQWNLHLKLTDINSLSLHQKMAPFMYHFNNAIIETKPNYTFDYNNATEDIRFLSNLNNISDVSEKIKEDVQNYLNSIELYLTRKNTALVLNTFSLSAQESKLKEILNHAYNKEIDGELLSSVSNTIKIVLDKTTGYKKSEYKENDIEELEQLQKKNELVLEKVSSELSKLQKKNIEKKEKTVSNKNPLKLTNKIDDIQENITEENLSNTLSYADIIKKISNEESNTTIEISSLQQKSPITNYIDSTVTDWFTDPKKALEREIKKYPNSTQTDEQQIEVTEAHLHPFVLDTFIGKCAQKFIDDNGTIGYAMAGQKYIKKLDKTIVGYYTWLVNEDGKIGYHRSFTKKKLTLDEDINGNTLYSKKQIEEILKSKNDNATSVSSLISEDCTISCNGLSIEITSNDTGNIDTILLPPNVN